MIEYNYSNMLYRIEWQHRIENVTELVQVKVRIKDKCKLSGTNHSILLIDRKPMKERVNVEIVYVLCIFEYKMTLITGKLCRIVLP